jgi:hypothetical protein
MFPPALDTLPRGRGGVVVLSAGPAAELEREPSGALRGVAQLAFFAARPEAADDPDAWGAGTARFADARRDYLDAALARMAPALLVVEECMAGRVAACGIAVEPRDAFTVATVRRARDAMLAEGEVLKARWLLVVPWRAYARAHQDWRWRAPGGLRSYTAAADYALGLYPRTRVSLGAGELAFGYPTANQRVVLARADAWGKMQLSSGVHPALPNRDKKPRIAPRRVRECYISREGQTVGADAWVDALHGAERDGARLLVVAGMEFCALLAVFACTFADAAAAETLLFGDAWLPLLGDDAGRATRLLARARRMLPLRVVNRD